jgi:rsbT co-antagonist protein RsbR
MAQITNGRTTSLTSILVKRRETILSDWIREMSGRTRRADLMKASELEEQCGLFIELLTKALSSAGPDLTSSAYDPVREMLGDVSRSRAFQGFSPSETASFVFSMKQPFFAAIRGEMTGDPDALANELWNATELLDGLGLYTTEVYQKSREVALAELSGSGLL